jgi:uncharacterized protein YneF (UPF0154 family)
MKIFLALLIVGSFFISRYYVQKQQENPPMNPELVKQDLENIKNSSKYR